MSFSFETLLPWGWNDYFAAQYAQLDSHVDQPGRVLLGNRERYRIQTSSAEVSASLSGKFRNKAETLPAVGDWVTIEIHGQSGVIHDILPRKSKFVRKVAGNQTQEQVIAANVDFVFIVTSLNLDLNLRRLERYITIGWNSGATPVIVLTKSDLCADIDSRIAEVEEIVAGVAVIAISVFHQTGLQLLQPYLQTGRTITLVGSSGVGKSTLINHLVGKEVMPVRQIREQDDRGRHTTTHRELILLPQGGLMIDNPGMRELQLWDADESDLPFEDILQFARQCRFKDCAHQNEPGCAVLQALLNGVLDSGRFESYQKLQKELRYIAIQQDAVAKRNQRKKWRHLTQMAWERSRAKRR